MDLDREETAPRAASSWEAVAAALFSERQETSQDSYESSGSESDGARSMTPDSENSDDEQNKRASTTMAMATAATAGAVARGGTSSVLSYAASQSQAAPGGAKRKRSAARAAREASQASAGDEGESISLCSSATHRPSLEATLPSPPSTSSPPPSLHQQRASFVSKLRDSMLSWSDTLTRLQPKCVVSEAARERGLRLLFRFQAATRGSAAGGRGVGVGVGGERTIASGDRSYHADFCSTPLPAPSPLTNAAVASALWIAIKAEGVRCAVPSRGLLARATGVDASELASTELTILLALKFDVFLGDVTHGRGGFEEGSGTGAFFVDAGGDEENVRPSPRVF